MNTNQFDRRVYMIYQFELDSKYMTHISYSVPYIYICFRFDNTVKYTNMLYSNHYKANLPIFNFLFFNQQNTYIVVIFIFASDNFSQKPRHYFLKCIDSKLNLY